MEWLNGLVAMHDRYIGNIAAIILVSMMLAANFGKITSRRRENKLIVHLLGNIGLYSIVEIVSCMLDGKQGTLMTVLLFLLNSMLFVINMELGYGWVLLISAHLRYKIPKRTRIFLSGEIILGIVLIVVNIFKPIIFVLDNNVYYEHGPLYFIYYVIAASYLVYTIVIYIFARRNGGVLKYFPVWMYVVPAIIGIILEGWLESSIMSVCNAAAISAVLASMQHEDVFRDRLTRLYNRAYLEELKYKLEEARNPLVSGIMLDMNDFKGINDNYGHAEGDEALSTVAGILLEVVGSNGDVIRYAGDEFVIILNTADKIKLYGYADKINAAFEEYNKTKVKPYELSASLGCANFNAGTQSINEFMNLIDKSMYESKRRYYKKHNIE